MILAGRRRPATPAGGIAMETGYSGPVLSLRSNGRFT